MGDQVILGSYYTTANTRRFYHISGNVENGGSGEAFAWASIMPASGVLKNLIVSLSASPTGNTTVSVRKNGESTPLSLTITPAMWTAAVNATDSNGRHFECNQQVSVAKGDTICYMIVTGAVAPDVMASMTLTT